VDITWRVWRKNVVSKNVLLEFRRSIRALLWAVKWAVVSSSSWQRRQAESWRRPIMWGTSEVFLNKNPYKNLYRKIHVSPQNALKWNKTSLCHLYCKAFLSMCSSWSSAISNTGPLPFTFTYYLRRLVTVRNEQTDCVCRCSCVYGLTTWISPVTSFKSCATFSTWMSCRRPLTFHSSSRHCSLFSRWFVVF